MSPNPIRYNISFIEFEKQKEEREREREKKRGDV